MLTVWCLRLGEVFSFPLFVYDPRYSARKKHVCQLVNHIFATAELAIWLTRRNCSESAGWVDIKWCFRDC